MTQATAPHLTGVKTAQAATPTTTPPSAPPSAPPSTSAATPETAPTAPGPALNCETLPESGRLNCLTPQGPLERVFGLSFDEVSAGIAEFFTRNVLSVNSALQAAVILAGLLVAYFIAQRAQPALKAFFDRAIKDYRLRRIGRAMEDILLPLFWVGFLWAVTFIFLSIGERENLLRITASLLNAWVLIRLLSSVVPSSFWARAITVIVWTVAALSVMGLLPGTIRALDSVSFSIGDTRLSLYLALKAMLIGALFLWGAMLTSRLLENRVRAVPNLTPSMRTLITQILKFLLIVIAIMVALSTAGIDLTAFAVFSGALGVGIGFGLQKVVSNFVSGLIILIDRSIRPGDVIAIGDTFGRITNLGARYTSIITRDGTEFLVPNEDFITQQVVNWSFSDTKVRQKVTIGVAYESDIELARQLVATAAIETERVLDMPEPICHIAEFGDSAVNLEARYWVADPENGLSNVKSDFLLKVWTAFHEHDIGIPFPQRDIHIKSDNGIPVEGGKPPAPKPG